MKSYLRFSTLCCAFVHLTCSCNSKEAPQGEPKSNVKETVKDAVTQDLKLYQGAKESLKESEEKHKSQLEQIDKETK